MNIKQHFSVCIKRRDLLKQLIISQLIIGQKDLFLGYLWWILDPILLMLIYWFLIGIIFGKGGNNYPLFILCGLVPFRAFAISFSQSVISLSSKINLITHIDFPRIFLPLSDVLANHFKLIFGFMVIFVTALLFSRPITLSYALLIVPFMLQTLLVCGIAMITSIIGVYFRDLKNLVQFLTRITLYLSPILYSIERIPEKYHSIYFACNPIAPIMESYRGIILNDGTLQMQLIITSAVQTSIIIILGILLFIKNESKILKYI